MDRGARPDGGSTESAQASGRTGSVGVLVVDDSPVFRRGMSRAVRVHAGLELVGEVEGGEAALDAIAAYGPTSCCSTCACPTSTASRSSNA